MAVSLSSANTYGGLTLSAVGSTSTYVMARGFIWAYGGTPTMTNKNGIYGAGAGSGSFSMSNQTVSCGAAHCYTRAYQTTDGATYTYSGVIDGGATRACNALPSLTTTTITDITNSGATGGGNITSAGYPATVTARGVCWAVSQNPTTSNSKTTNGSGTGSFTSTITGLADGTTYYVRAYATNSYGTGYGAQVSFTTTSRPQLTTTAVSNITKTTAQSGGNVTSAGGGTVTDRGICWSTSQNPTTLSNHISVSGTTGSFIAVLTGISEGFQYYVRAFATNSVGTNYGAQQTFTNAIRLTGNTNTANYPQLGWSGCTSVSTWSGATHQKWYQKLSSAGSYSQIAALGIATGNTYQNLALLPNTSYDFYTTFYGGSTETLPSNVVTINNIVDAPIATYSNTLKIV